MRIETEQGRWGDDDKIILFTSTNKRDKNIEKERISIFKVGVLVNQLAFNEFKMKNGLKKRLVKAGRQSLFAEAMKEAIKKGEDDVNWAESCNLELVKKWAERWSIRSEDVEAELKRTFQRSLDEWINSGGL